MAVNDQAQTTIYEKTIDDADLEAQLEKRQTAKQKASAAAKAYTEAHAAVKSRLDELDVADGPVRVGRFVITHKKVPGRAVSFETAESTRLYVSLLDTE